METQKTRGQKTSERLLRAAAQVIGEKGYSAATIDEIVEVAGVSKGTAYVHYKSKAAIAQRVLESGVGELTDAFRQIAETAPDAVCAMTGMIDHFATQIFEQKSFGRFLVSELWREGRAWSEAMRAYEKELIEILKGQIVRGQEEGSMRPGVDPSFEAVAIVGMVLTTALYYISDGAFGEDVAAVTAQKEVFVTRICDFVRHANS